jgi:hypothetical protein
MLRILKSKHFSSTKALIQHCRAKTHRERALAKGMDPDLGLLSSDIPTVNPSPSSDSSSAAPSPSPLLPSSSTQVENEEFQLSKYYIPYDRSRCLFCQKVSTNFMKFFFFVLVANFFFFFFFFFFCYYSVL